MYLNSFRSLTQIFDGGVLATAVLLENSDSISWKRLLVEASTFLDSGDLLHYKLIGQYLHVALLRGRKENAQAAE